MAGDKGVADFDGNHKRHLLEQAPPGGFKLGRGGFFEGEENGAARFENAPVAVNEVDGVRASRAHSR